MILLADVVMAPIFLFNPVYGVLILTLPISIEFGVLLWRKWGAWRRALRDSAVVNVASTMFGIVVIFTLSHNSADCRLPECLISLDRWGQLFFLWLCSVVIEGIVLKLMYRKDAKPVWKTALLMNAASYVLLSPLFLFFLEN